MLAGALLAGVAGPAAVILWRRARIAERLLDGRSAVARWTYGLAGAGAYLDELLAEERRAGRRLFRVAGVLIGAAAILSVNLDARGARPSHLAFLGVVLVLGAVTELGPRWLRAERGKASPEAVVSSDAAYIAGALYVWRGPYARLTDVGVVPGADPALRIVYSVSPLWGGGETAVTIPIPRGGESAAAEAARALREKGRRSDAGRT